MKKIIHINSRIKSVALFAALSLVFFLGCVRDVEVDLPDHTPQLVVNCTFTPDSIWVAHVSASAGILETTGPIPITNAVVFILKDGVVVDSLTHFTDGYYVGSTFPQPADNYTIRVSANGYATVEGSSYVPTIIPISAVTWRDSAMVYPDGTVEGEIRFTINDPGGVANYYEAVVARLDTFDFFGDTLITWVPVFVNTIDPALNAAVYNFTGSIYFTDDLFEGETKELKLLANQFDFEDSTHLYLIQGNLTEDYYQYSVGLAKYLENEFNPFAEPVLIHNNIQNGFGVFAGYAADSILVK
jgi:Domain of unknown function (DUF4249)